ncbi:MAG: DUF4292 domain-containing protein [Eudoraea sp.]|nr:DUF4292 domain-containing protein [Eudoraea sp.]
MSYIQKWITFCMLILLVVSCKSGKIVTDGTVDSKLSAKFIIKNHYKNQADFRTLSGRMKIDYSDGFSSQGVSVSMRMEKDKAIWLSAPLGVVKAYITPTRVSFYNKLQNEYFDGDFSYLSKLLGSELDFEQVQNLLLGQAIFDLRADKYDLAIAEETYELKPRKAAALFKLLFQIEPQHFKMATQQLTQPLKKRLLQINYNKYQQKDNRIFPYEIGIVAIDKDERTTIAIEYRNMEFNRPLNFPYKIPKGFDEIVLK